VKIKLNKKDLISALQIVQNIITPKATLPILSNILIETYNNKLRLISTDLDIGITCLLPVEISEQGAITLPARRFIEIIKELSDEEIILTTKKNNTTIIETKKCQFKLLSLPKEEFPKLPELKDKEVLKLQQGQLKKMINLTSFAVSNDESRYVLNGILFKILENKLTLVATDGRRLAVVTEEIESKINKEISVVIPLKTILELNRDLQEEGEVSVVISNNQVLFDLGRIVIISRLIEGEFPDYKQVIPAVIPDKLKVNREEFLAALKRAALLITPDYQAVKFEISKNKLFISKSTPDVGESWEELNAQYLGKDLVVGFNPHYLADVLKNLSDLDVEIEIAESEKPAALRSGGYVYIVLPMRLS
jgi:DNA polymerase III subunit beta